MTVGTPRGAEETYGRARADSLDAGDDPKDWPEWAELDPARRAAMERVARVASRAFDPRRIRG